MAKPLFTNNATGALSASILAGDLSLTLVAGGGVTFPSPTAGDYMWATLQAPTGGATEIVKVTARTGEVFTMAARGQQGTSAAAWPAGTLVELRSTAQVFTDIFNLLAVGAGDVYLANTQTFTGVNTFDNQVNVMLTGTQRFKAQRGQLYDLSTGVGSERIAFEYQQIDTATGGAGQQIYNAVFFFRSTGTGTIGTYGGKPQSQSFWFWLHSNMEKWGSGSGHAFTANVTLMNTSNYTEGGGFQGSVSNTAAAGHYLSLFEGIVNDGNFDTNMNCAALRVQKGAATSVNPTNVILVSGEGTGTIDRIITMNPSAGSTNKFHTGIDLSLAQFTSGRSMLLPNNTNLSWMTPSAAAVPIMYLDSLNIFRIQFPGTGTYEGVAICDTAQNFQFTADNYGGAGGDHIALYVGGALRRVTMGAINSGGTGFRQLLVPN